MQIHLKQHSTFTSRRKTMEGSEKRMKTVRWLLLTTIIYILCSRSLKLQINRTRFLSQPKSLESRGWKTAPRAEQSVCLCGLWCVSHFSDKYSSNFNIRTSVEETEAIRKKTSFLKAFMPIHQLKKSIWKALPFRTFIWDQVHGGHRRAQIQIVFLISENVPTKT